MSIGPIKNKSINFLVAVTVICNTGFAYAGSTPAPAPAATPAPLVCSDGGPGTTISVNPQSLEDLMLKRNLNIVLDLQNLYTAKENVSLAQAHLMPSLNINLTSSFNIVSFAVSLIAALVPFLIPSNWLLLDEANDQYKAEGVGYYVAKLNSLASIDGMYYTVVSYVDTYNALVEQQTMAQQTSQLVIAKYNLGLATQADVKQAQENLDQANARVSAAENSIQQQNLAILQLVCYDPETVLKVDMQHETPSSLEGKSIDDIDTATITTSPEYLQMNYLIAAAQENMKATEFSWINSGTISANGSNGGSANLSKAQVGIAFQIGPALIPSVKLADLQTDIERTQQSLLVSQQQNAIGTTVDALTNDLAQLEYYQDAENSSRVVYNDYIAKYQTGATDLLHVFSAQQDLITQEMNRIISQNNVDVQRVGLKRIGREDQFAAIKPCNLDGLGQKKSWFKKVGGIFSSPKLLVDQACANTQQEPSMATGK